MKIRFIKILSFSLSFTIGAGFVWVLSLPLIAKIKQIPVAEPPPVIETSKPAVENFGAELEIKFKGFDDLEFEQEARFEISNLSNETYIYDSPRVDLEEPLFICSELKINEIKINLRKSCDGLEEYELKPGETKKFRVTLNYYFWRKDKSYKIGFNFRRFGENENKVFWSERLTFTRPIANRLLMKQKKYGVR